MNAKNKKLAMFFIGTVFIITVIALLYIMGNKDETPLSITETHCSSEGVWLKYDLIDETPFFVRNIDTCEQNTANGWVGEIMWYAKTPAGNEYRMCGYTATPESTQKISCGGGLSQEGKRFCGRYVPNEGGGRYTVVARGVYYEKSENYQIPHEFELEDSVSITCPTFKSECEDGTPINMCSNNKPLYCTSNGDLIQKASRCGCPSGLEREELGQSCVFPTPEYDEPDDIEPFPDISDEDTITIEEPTSITSEGIEIDQSTAKWILVGVLILLGIIIVVITIFAERKKVWRR